MKRTSHAFSLGELLVALGLIAVAILSVLALSITIAKSNREGIDHGVGNVVATQISDRLIDQLKTDTPAGSKEAFFAKDFISTPYDQGVLSNNNTDFSYEIYARTVTDTSGSSLGGTTLNNRLKKLDVMVHWWDSNTKDHQGYGELQVSVSRLINEAEL